MLRCFRPSLGASLRGHSCRPLESASSSLRAKRHSTPSTSADRPMRNLRPVSSFDEGAQKSLPRHSEAGFSPTSPVWPPWFVQTGRNSLHKTRGRALWARMSATAYRGS